MALDQDGQILLGLLRTLIVKDKHGNDTYAFKTEVFRASEAGEVKRLFGIDDISELSAIAGVNGDVLLLGNGHPYIGGSFDAELARYTPSGRLVWRQTALHKNIPGVFDDPLHLGHAAGNGWQWPCAARDVRRGYATLCS